MPEPVPLQTSQRHDRPSHRGLDPHRVIAVSSAPTELSRARRSHCIADVNADVDRLLSDADAALRAGNVQNACVTLGEAGDCAAMYGLSRAALRCYRRALELDVTQVALARRAAKIASRIALASGPDWQVYASVLETQNWPRFGCREAQTMISDASAFALCPIVGPVLALAMPEPDLVEARPIGRFAAMPRAMAMLILRRALFPSPRDYTPAPHHVRVAFGTHGQVVLDETGDWART